MDELIKWQTIAIIVTAVVTCFMTLATCIMAYIAKKTFELQSGKPNVIVYAHLRDDAPQIIQITIENTGTAAAYDISFTIPDNFKLKAHGISRDKAELGESIEDGAFKKGIKYLPVGKKRTFNWGQYGGIEKSLCGKPIEIKTFFYNTKKQLQPMVLNILTIEDFWKHTANTPHYVTQVKHIEAISKNIKDLQCTINTKLKPVSAIDTYRYAYLSYLLLKDKYSERRLTHDFYHVHNLYWYRDDFGLTKEQINKAEAEAKEIFKTYQEDTSCQTS